MHEYYMNKALIEAKKAFKKGDVPVGAIVVKDNKIISKAHNLKEKKGISVYHAEILAITKACKKLKTWHLDGCTIYVTLEPCCMCAGALIQSRITGLVYGCNSDKFGYIESIDSILSNKMNNHIVKVESQVLEQECKQILKDFFKTKRK